MSSVEIIKVEMVAIQNKNNTQERLHLVCALATSTTGQNARNSKPGQILSQVFRLHMGFICFLFQQI